MKCLLCCMYHFQCSIQMLQQFYYALKIKTVFNTKVKCLFQLALSHWLCVGGLNTILKQNIVHMPFLFSFCVTRTRTNRDMNWIQFPEMARSFIHSIETQFPDEKSFRVDKSLGCHLQIAKKAWPNNNSSNGM